MASPAPRTSRRKGASYGALFVSGASGLLVLGLYWGEAEPWQLDGTSNARVANLPPGLTLSQALDTCSYAQGLRAYLVQQYTVLGLSQGLNCVLLLVVVFVGRRPRALVMAVHVAVLLMALLHVLLLPPENKNSVHRRLVVTLGVINAVGLACQWALQPRTEHRT